MQTIVIVLNPGKLENPDLDLRYQIPDRIEELSGGLIKDNGYDYIDTEDGQPYPLQRRRKGGLRNSKQQSALQSRDRFTNAKALGNISVAEALEGGLRNSESEEILKCQSVYKRDKRSA